MFIFFNSWRDFLAPLYFNHPLWNSLSLAFDERNLARLNLCFLKWGCALNSAFQAVLFASLHIASSNLCQSNDLGDAGVCQCEKAAFLHSLRRRSAFKKRQRSLVDFWLCLWRFMTAQVYLQTKLCMCVCLTQTLCHCWSCTVFGWTCSTVALLCSRMWERALKDVAVMKCELSPG